MVRPITGIDHAIVGVRRLDGAAETWRRLGFTLSPRGRHYGWGTANYCIMFAHDYVELLGIVDPAGFTNNLDRFLRVREGLLGLAFATDDAAAARTALTQRGVAVSGPHELARALEATPGRETRLEFALVRPEPREAPALNAFLVEHRTPDLLRRPEWLVHANTARRIAAVTVVVEDPPALAGAYERLMGAGATTLTDDTLAVHTGEAAIVFARPDDLSLLHPELEIPDLAPPYLFALRIAVDDLDEARRVLAARGIATKGERGEAAIVSPADACGVALELVADRMAA
jgi:hypothetical protein